MHGFFLFSFCSFFVRYKFQLLSTNRPLGRWAIIHTQSAHTHSRDRQAMESSRAYHPLGHHPFPTPSPFHPNNNAGQLNLSIGKLIRNRHFYFAAIGARVGWRCAGAGAFPIHIELLLRFDCMISKTSPAKKRKGSNPPPRRRGPFCNAASMVEKEEKRFTPPHQQRACACSGRESAANVLFFGFDMQYFHIIF